MTNAPAGWYPNPEDPRTERWWSGQEWSDQTRPRPPVVDAGPRPDNYLVWAILSTLFCCLPFGIASIVYASRVDSLWSAGDVTGARKASADAKKWATWAAATYAVFFAVILVIIALVALFGEPVQDDPYRY